MNIRFTFEAVIGALSILAVIYFGSIGIGFIVLLPVVIKLTECKLDEREKILFYRVGNLTFGLTVMGLAVINELSNYTVNGNQIIQHWYFLSIATILFIHGLSGLIIFKIS